MRFIIDKMLSPDLVRLLESEYPGSKHTEHELGERAKDSEIWNYALGNGFTILSRDRDFAGMSVKRGHPPKVVPVGTGNSTTTTVAELITDRARGLAVSVRNSRPAVCYVSAPVAQS